MAGFKAVGPRVLTGGLGVELLAFGFRINGVSNPDSLWQAKANSVVSVVRAAAGRYTVTLNKPYPRELVAGIVQESRANNVTTDRRAYIVNDSYSKTAGTFEIAVVNDDGTPAVDADLEDNATVFVILVVQRVDLLVTSHGS